MRLAFLVTGVPACWLARPLRRACLQIRQDKPALVYSLHVPCNAGCAKRRDASRVSLLPPYTPCGRTLWMMRRTTMKEVYEVMASRRHVVLGSVGMAVAWGVSPPPVLAQGSPTDVRSLLTTLIGDATPSEG